MDVAGLTFSAIAFVDQAIKTGTTLAKIFRDCGDAGKHVYNATVRLEAQKYTLELWKKAWKAKALTKQSTGGALEDGYRRLWGEEGYAMVLKSLAQLNLKFGEAFRALRSIDPESFGPISSAVTGDKQAPSSKDNKEEKRPSPPSSSPGLTPPDSATTQSDSTNRRWYRRLSPSDPQAIWRRRSPSPVSVAGEPATPEERVELEQQALQQKLSPGTKFKWSLSHKEEVRSLINDIDDWLALLQTLATQCEADRVTNKGPGGTTPSSIRAAAKALYAALRNIPSDHDLDFKLEKERADSSYFEQVVGRLEYLGPSDRSFKFPLLVSNNRGASKPILLLAETIYSSTSMETLPPLDKTTSFGEIVKCLEGPPSDGQDSLRSLLFRSQHTTIVIHGISGSSTASSTMQEALLRCTFAELLQAETAVTPLVALWKRLQLACIIAISVLHLYETGWISEHLETSDFHFFGSPDSQYQEWNRIAPYISAPGSKNTDGTITNGTTPFDCLRRTQVPSNLLGSRDERLATLFHKLGIVLFELGRGVQHRDVFKYKTPSEGAVLAEIEKIQFGRMYRDLVKVCLTGSLYAASEINVDSQFNRVVVEKYAALLLSLNV
jgi:hypothetical protein